MFKITICLIADAKEFFTFFSFAWGKQIILPYIKMSWHPLKVFQLLINRSWTLNQGTTAAISYRGYQYLKLYCCIPTRKYLNGKSATEEMLPAAHLSAAVVCTKLVLHIVVSKCSLRDTGDGHCSLLVRPHSFPCNTHTTTFQTSNTKQAQGRVTQVHAFWLNSKPVLFFCMGKNLPLSKQVLASSELLTCYFPSGASCTHSTHVLTTIKFIFSH